MTPHNKSHKSQLSYEINDNASLDKNLDIKPLRLNKGF